ncbi:MAG: hypothetical protein LBQ43_01095 [Holosporales bacterium]|jgi:hypothetical protein|nr:hypothetical protein [Holosporales bacterium]
MKLTIRNIKYGMFIGAVLSFDGTMFGNEEVRIENLEGVRAVLNGATDSNKYCIDLVRARLAEPDGAYSRQRYAPSLLNLSENELKSVAASRPAIEALIASIKADPTLTVLDNPRMVACCRFINTERNHGWKNDYERDRCILEAYDERGIDVPERVKGAFNRLFERKPGICYVTIKGYGYDLVLNKTDAEFIKMFLKFLDSGVAEYTTPIFFAGGKLTPTVYLRASERAQWHQFAREYIEGGGFEKYMLSITAEPRVG